MPWHETQPVNERTEFAAALQCDAPRTEAHRQSGISCQTGYKVWGRIQVDEPNNELDRPGVVHHAVQNFAGGMAILSHGQ